MWIFTCSLILVLIKIKFYGLPVASGMARQAARNCVFDDFI